MYTIIVYEKKLESSNSPQVRGIKPDTSDRNIVFPIAKNKMKSMHTRTALILIKQQKKVDSPNLLFSMKFVKKNGKNMINVLRTRNDALIPWMYKQNAAKAKNKNMTKKMRIEIRRLKSMNKGINPYNIQAFDLYETNVNPIMKKKSIKESIIKK